jgi:hypothetical protein
LGPIEKQIRRVQVAARLQDRQYSTWILWFRIELSVKAVFVPSSGCLSQANGILRNAEDCPPHGGDPMASYQGGGQDYWQQRGKRDESMPMNGPERLNHWEIL